MKKLLCNNNISDEITEKLKNNNENRELLFIIEGKLNKKSSYEKSYLSYADKKIIILSDGEVNEYPLETTEGLEIVHMYGNSALIRKIGNKKDLIFRMANDGLALCDTACEFFKTVKDGGDEEEALEVVESVFMKRKCYCEKCGRALRSPDAECLNCQSKTKLVLKFSKHLKPEAGILILSLFISACVTALSLLPPYLTKVLVDNLQSSSLEKYGRDVIGKKLITVVILLLCSHILSHLLAGIKNYVLRNSGHRILFSLRKEVYEKAQYLPLSFYDKNSTGSVINRISNDTNTLQSFMMRITQEVIVQFFTLIGIVIVMVCMDWRLTLLSLIPVPLVAVIAKRFSKKVLPFYRRIWRRSSSTNGFLTDSIPGVKVIKSFTGEREAAETYKKYTDDWYETDRSAAKMIVSFPQFIAFLATCGSLLIWGVGGFSVLNGSGISLGLLVSFISYASMFYTPVNFFANLSDSYQGAVAAAERIFDIIDSEPEKNFGKGNLPEDVKGKIEFKNVNFSYDKAKKILKNINLTIEAGDIVGVVGTTGSGKSTLINLFLRYYDNYEGHIFLDGKDIQSIDMDYFRDHVGYVQQEPMLFHDTIYNNIAMGGKNPTVEDVFSAAEIARAHNFIIKQPDGYDSVVGERGVGLSGGEKQRLSIARAVLKNPSILVFDEATASVDSETEHHIQAAIEALIGGRTTIMIAHRLSTLSMANKIVVLDNGEIIECGTPAELLAKKGKYYKLVEIQSLSDKVRQTKQEERFD